MQSTALASLHARIVNDLHSLADGWKAVASEVSPDAAPKKRRAPAKRAKPKA
jgi:hypothetical protein